MKNRLLLGLFAFFSILNLSSCDDVEPLDPAIIVPADPNNPDPADPAAFSVKIDGTAYIGLASQAYISGGSLQLTSTRANGDSFGFLVTGGNNVGTYPANQNILAFNPSGEEFSFWSVNPDDPLENTGSITITNIDTANQTISGTFEFTGYWSDDSAAEVAPREFTDGVFINIPYTSDSPTDDTFTATLDGSNFATNDIFATQINVGGQAYISLGATSASNTSISLTLDGDITPGTYPLTGNQTADSVQVMYTTASGGGGLATSGSVIITEKTADRVAGTFTGTIVDGTTTYQITNGTFDVAY